MRFNLRNIKTKDALFGAGVFFALCLLPGISNILVGSDGIIAKGRDFVSGIFKKK